MIPAAVDLPPTRLHHTVGFKVVPGSVDLVPAFYFHTFGRIVIPSGADLLPSCCDRKCDGYFFFDFFRKNIFLLNYVRLFCRSSFLYCFSLFRLLLLRFISCQRLCLRGGFFVG